VSSSLANDQPDVAHPLLQVKRRSSKAGLLPQLNHSTSIAVKTLSESRSSETVIASSNEDSRKLNDDNYSIIYDCLNERKTSAGKTRTKEPDPDEDKYWKNVLKPHFNEMINLHKGMLHGII
jgi:hypothetical protein